MSKHTKTRVVSPDGACASSWRHRASVLAVLALSSLALARAEPVITNVDPHDGSTAGGTRVTISGTGFADNFNGANAVFIGSTPCDIETFYSTDSQIVCFTRPHAPGYSPSTDWNPVTVISFGSQVSTCGRSRCAFRYIHGRTPYVERVHTPLIKGHANVRVEGRLWPDFGLDQVVARFGPDGQACSLRSEEADDVAIEFEGKSSETDSWGYMQCRPGEVPAGTYNVSLRMDGWYGDSYGSSNSFRTAGNAQLEPYHVMVLAQPTSISPSSGGTGGGTVLTLRGKGFDKVAANNVITVGGTPCDVTSAAYDEIKCETRPLPAGASACPLSSIPGDNRCFPGGRGALLELFPMPPSRWNDIAQMRADPDFPAAARNNTATHLVDAMAQDLDYMGPYDIHFRQNYGSRVSALFTAPATGRYRFVVAGDDRVELWVSTDADAANLRRISYLPSHTGSWTSYEANDAYTGELQLVAGRQYFMEMTHMEWGGGDHASAGFIFLDKNDGAHVDNNDNIEAVQDIRMQDSSGTESVQEVFVDSVEGGTFTVTLDGRTSAPIAHNATAAEAKAAVEPLFGIPCVYDDAGISFYDLDTFEDGPGGQDDWQGRNYVNPRVTRAQKFCGLYGQHHYHYNYGGTSGGRNFEWGSNLEPGQTADGYNLRDFPYMCMAYRFTPETNANMLVWITDIGWVSINAAQFEPESYGYAKAGDWGIIFDGAWHHTCINLLDQLDAHRGVGIGGRLPTKMELRSIIWHTPTGRWEPTRTAQYGEFWIDEFSVSDAPRTVARAPGYEKYGSGDPADGLGGYELATLQVDRDTHSANAAAGTPARYGFEFTFNREVLGQCRHALPHITVTPGNSIGGVVPNASVLVRSDASPRMAGFARVSMHGSHQAEVYPYESPWHVKEKLLALNAFGEDITVQDSSSSCFDRRFRVTMTHAHGWQPFMDVDDEPLTDAASTASVARIRTGGSLVFPIPGHMLRAPSPTPSLALAVNGLQSEMPCDLRAAPASDWGGCGFKYDASVTPSVTGASPASGAMGTAITITGARFGAAASDVTVTIGDARCGVTSVAADGTSITCTAGKARGGTHAVKVHVAGAGNAVAASSPPTFAYTAAATGATPAAGSTYGGVALTIQGSNFVGELDTAAASVKATVTLWTWLSDGVNATRHRVSAPCAVTSVAWDAIVCTAPSLQASVEGTPAAAAAIDLSAATLSALEASNMTVSVVASADATTVLSATLTRAFTYSAALTPALTSISPASGMAGGNVELTLAGSGFGSNAANVRVTLGDSVACAVTAVADAQIKCRVPATQPAMLKAHVFVAGKGDAAPASAAAGTYHAKLQVDAWGRVETAAGANRVNPAGGATLMKVGVSGGTLIEVDGGDFGTNVTAGAAAVYAKMHAEDGVKVRLRMARPEVQAVTVVAEKFDASVPAHGVVDDVQTVTIARDNAAHAVGYILVTVPTAQGLDAACCGTFTLSVNNVSAANALAHNAAADAVAAAIEATGATTKANVTRTATVSGGATLYAWAITFAGKREPVGAIAVDGSTLLAGVTTATGETARGVEAYAGSFTLSLSGVTPQATAPIGVDATGAQVMAALAAVPGVGDKYIVKNATRADSASVPALPGAAAGAASTTWTITLQPKQRKGSPQGTLPALSVDVSGVSGTLHPVVVAHPTVGQAGHWPLAGSWRVGLGESSGNNGQPSKWTSLLPVTASDTDFKNALAASLTDIEVLGVSKETHAGGDANGGGFGGAVGYGHGNTGAVRGEGEGATWLVTFVPSAAAKAAGRLHADKRLPLLVGDAYHLNGTSAVVSTTSLRSNNATYAWATRTAAGAHPALSPSRMVFETPAVAGSFAEYQQHVLARSSTPPVAYWPLDEPHKSAGVANKGSLGALGDLSVTSVAGVRLGVAGALRRSPSFGAAFGVYTVGDEALPGKVNHTGVGVRHRTGLNTPSFAFEAWVRPTELPTTASAPVVVSADVLAHADGGVGAGAGAAGAPVNSNGFALWLTPCGRFELWLGTGTNQSDGTGGHVGLLDAAAAPCAAHDTKVAAGGFPWSVLTSTGATVAAPGMYHVVAQYEASTRRAALYVNGASSAAATLPASAPFAPNKGGRFTIGGLPRCDSKDMAVCAQLASVGHAGQPEPLNATMDEVALFAAPLPAHTIAARAAWDADVEATFEVVQAGVASECKDATAGCKFAFSPSSTPVVRHVDPVDGYATSEITIHGDGFSSTIADNSVDIGGAACSITSATATKLVCVAGVQKNGRYPLKVHVKGKGSAPPTHTWSYVVIITNVTPNQGSLQGGTLVTLSGYGFSATLAWNRPAVQNVTLGKLMHKTPCDVVSATPTQIVCRTRPANEWFSGNFSLAVGDPALGPDFSALAEFRSAACAFIFRHHTSPFLKAVTPRTGGAGTVLTITGSGFSASMADNTVTIGDATCALSAATTTSITCTLGEGGAGAHRVDVLVGGARNMGTAMGPWYVIQPPSPAGIDFDTQQQGRVIVHNHTALDHSLEGDAFYQDKAFANRTHLLFHSTGTVTGLSVLQGSAGGGTALSISGSGFPAAAGAAEGLQVTVGNTPCTVTGSSYGQLNCTTQSLREVRYEFETWDWGGGSKPDDSTGERINGTTNIQWADYNEAYPGQSLRAPDWQFRYGLLYGEAHAWRSGDSRCSKMHGSNIFAKYAQEWQDYTVTARAMCTGNSCAMGVTARGVHDVAAAGSSYYRLTADVSHNCIRLIRHNAGEPTTLGALDQHVAYHEWHELSLSVVGNRVRAVFNGDVVADIVDDSLDAIPQGAPGLFTYGGGSNNYFDSLHVHFHSHGYAGYPSLPASGGDWFGRVRVWSNAKEFACGAVGSTAQATLPLRPSNAVLQASHWDNVTNTTVSDAPAVPAPGSVSRANACVFQYHPHLTPTIGKLSNEGADEANRTFGAPALVRAGDVLVVEGHYFGASNAVAADGSSVSVDIGGVACPLAASGAAQTTTRLRCVVPGLVAGDHTVRVHVKGAGYSPRHLAAAAMHAPTVRVRLDVASVTPDVTGFGGGVQLELHGAGFTGSAGKVKVDTCGAPCNVVGGNASSVRCVIGALRPFDTRGESTTRVKSVITAANNQDDAYMEWTGRNYGHSYELCFGACGGDEPGVALRFRDLQIPRGAKVRSAFVRVTSRTRRKGLDTAVVIAGEAAGHAAPLNSVWHSNAPAQRPRTAKNITWAFDEWRVGGLTVESPDVADIVREITNRPDWRLGNAIALFFSRVPGTSDTRSAYSSETALSEGDAPQLVVEYERRDVADVWAGLKDTEECDALVSLDESLLLSAVGPDLGLAADPCPQSDAELPNVAAGKRAWSTSDRNFWEAADQANDDHTGTYWRPERWEEGHQWGVDLGSLHAVRRAWFDHTHTASQYKLEASVDNKTWVQVYRRRGDLNSNQYHLAPRGSPTMLVRYFRYTMVERNGVDNGYAGLREFRAWGCPALAPWRESLLEPNSTAAVDAGGGGVGGARRLKQPAKEPKKVKFVKSITPEVTGVSPHRGSTAGGTTLTINGTNFQADTDKVAVYIDGVACAVGAASTTQITCVTGAHKTTDRMLVKVLVKGAGEAAPHKGAWYQYIDLWSAKTTWGGHEPPIEGDSVSIPPGQTVLVDVSPPRLFAVLVQGHLVFADEADGTFDAHYIMVNGGSMTVGTEDEPYQHRLTITLHGLPRQLWLPIYGTKVIGVRHGVLDLHGAKHEHSWTRLAATAHNQSQTLELQEAVTWPVGAEIIVTSTDWTKEHTEECTITAVRNGGKTLDIKWPLSYQHLGETRHAGEHSFDLRAEVALLSHNVVVQGDASSEANQFGGTVMLHSHGHESVVGRIENVEFRQMGQAFTLGKYPVHFHMIGNVRQSYIRRNSNHHTYNRAFTIHGVHHLRVQHNVAYNNMGHTYFIEDAIETKNIIEGNLGALTRPSMSLLNTDQTPATFWITNPDNYIRGNVAAGSQNYGFWYRGESAVSGAAAAAGMGANVCPRHTPLLQFEGNVAHSNGRYGLRIYDTYEPREDPCDSKSPMKVAHMKDLLTYRNGKNGVTVTAFAGIVFDGFKAIDNHLAGFEGSSSQGGFTRGEWGVNRLDNWLFVGRSGEDVPIDEGTTLGIRGSADNGLTVRNATFAHYTGDDRLHAIGHCTKCARFAPLDAGWETRFEQITWVNSTNRAYWRWPHEGIIYDVDGTASGTGVPGTSVVSYSPILDAFQAECVFADLYSPDAPWFTQGRVCRNMRFGRWGVTDHDPESLRFKAMNFSIGAAAESRQWQKKSRVNKHGWGITLPINRKYRFNWDLQPADRVDLKKIGFHAGEFSPATDYLDMVLKYMQEPDHFEVGGRNQGTVFTEGPPNATSAAGSHWWDSDEFDVHVHFTARDASTTRNAFTGTFEAWDCPRSGCPPPVAPGMPEGDGVIRPWSDPATWSYLGVPVPVDGSDVVIPEFITVMVDVEDTPLLGKLTIFGNLYFASHLPEKHLKLHAHAILVYGWLSAGEPGLPFYNNATIALYGDRDYAGIKVENANLGSKVIAVVGSMRLAGRPRKYVWTRLGETANAGASVVKVQGKVDWHRGERISIASTDFEPAHLENRVITSVAWDPNTRLTSVGVDAPLAWKHLSVEETHGGKSIEMRAEVAVLDRNVKVVAGDAPGEATTEGVDFGVSIAAVRARLTVTDWVTKVQSTVWRNGAIGMQSVEVADFGQNAFDRRFGVEFNGIGDVSGLAEVMALVQDCVLHTGHGKGFSVAKATGPRFRNNVVHMPIESGFELLKDSADVVVERNLVMWTRHRGSHKEADEEKVSDLIDPCFDIEGQGHTVIGNVAAGSERAGFKMEQEECERTRPPVGSYAGVRMRDNTAHSCGFGYWVNDMRGTAKRCVSVHGLTTYANWEFGLLGWPPTSWDVRNLRAADNKVGMMLNTHTPDPKTHRTDPSRVMDASDVLLVGHTTTTGKDCAEPIPAKVYKFGWQRYTRDPGRVGMWLSYSNSAGRKPLTKAPPYKGASYPTVTGKGKYTDVVFAQYKKACNMQNPAIESNEESPDAQFPSHFSRIQWPGSETDSKVKFHAPSAAWINEEDCVDMDCDGPKHILLTDEDGTLLGGAKDSAVFSRAEFYSPEAVGAIVPTLLKFDANNVERSEAQLARARGIPRPVGCTDHLAWNAHSCQNDFNYRMMVIESMDTDTELRRLSPIALLSGGALNQGSETRGYLDLLNGPQDHGWCFGYTCLKRISTFYSIVATPERYTMVMTSSPPQHMRLHLLHAQPDDAIVITLLYPSPQRLEVYAGRDYVPDMNFDGTEHKSVNNKNYVDQHPATTMPNGANAYFRKRREIEITLRGASSISIRTVPVVQVSLKMAVSIEDFFDVQDQFVSNVAFVLNIDPSRIRVVDVVAGSVQVDFEIEPILPPKLNCSDPVQALTPNCTGAVAGSGSGGGGSGGGSGSDESNNVS